MAQQLRAAIYCRLSEEDRDKQDAENESESIQNQKAMLRGYAAEQGWQVWAVYSDEDYTGADRSRPAFNRLLRDAQAGRFDIVLCKSQSRFTRELELVEKYLHGLFPMWGIRFVGYADHADTANRGNKKARQINGLVNEWYLEDLSDNIRTVFRTKQQNGAFIGSFAPYGYEKCPQDKNRLQPDEPAAAIVRDIFAALAAGETPAGIAARLNDAGVPNPSTYKAAKHPAFKRAGMTFEGWRSASVRSIAQNPVYCGDMRQHVREKVSYKSDEVRRVPAAQQVIVQNTHTPLVSRPVWQKAQQALSQYPVRQRRPQDPLQRLCRCGVCDKMLQVRYAHGRRYFGCATHHVLVQAEQVRLFLQQNGMMIPDDVAVQPAQPAEAAMEWQQVQRDALVRQMQAAYADMTSGILPPDAFAALQAAWQKQWRQLETASSAVSNAAVFIGAATPAAAVPKGAAVRIWPRQKGAKLPQMVLYTDDVDM